jgi:uncharacterized surface protein with fasciclin (FAS1) repeats
MKKIVLSLTCAFVLGGAWTPASADDVIATAEHAGSLKKFAAALKSTELANVLTQAGPYTVFAPSDQAVAKLPPGTWDSLLKDKPRLEKMIATHVVQGKFLVMEIKPGDMKTMEGHTIHLTSDNGMVTVDGASITQSDLVADNGVVHEIDQVVLPD